MKRGGWRRGRKRRLTPVRFAIDEEYPPRLDTPSTPLDAALLDLLYRGILLRVIRRCLDRAGRVEGREHESKFPNGLGGGAVFNKVYRAHVDRNGRCGRHLCLARKPWFRGVRARCAIRTRIVRIHLSSTKTWRKKRKEAMSGLR